MVDEKYHELFLWKDAELYNKLDIDEINFNMFKDDGKYREERHSINPYCCNGFVATNEKINA